MWIRKVQLRNAGPFEDFTADLTRGSIGVFGRNGKGKSTLLNYMYAAVTNDFGRFAATKDKCVRNTAPERAEAFVYVEVEHDQKLIKIKRRLRGKSEVSIDDGKPETDANKGQRMIYEALGVDGALLEQYVFKPQDQIYDFINTTPAVRAKAYQVLCRTGACETAWEILGEFLNKDKELNSEIVDNSDELTREIGDAEVRKQEFETQIAAEAERLLNAKSRASAQRILDDDRRCGDLTKEQERLALRLETLTPEVIRTKQLRELAESTVRTLEKKITNGRTSVDAARAALRSFAAYTTHQGNLKKLQDTAATLVTEGQTKKAPKAPTRLGEETSLRNQFSAMQHKLVEAQDIWEAFGEGNQVKCPTCGTSVDAMHDHIEAMKQIVISYPAKLNALEDELKEIGDYHTRMSLYKTWKAGYDARVTANAQALANLTDMEMPEGDKEELQDRIAAFATLEVQLRSARSKLDAAKTEASTAEANFNSASDRADEVTREIDAKHQDPELVRRAKIRIDEDTTATNNTARLQGQLDGVLELIESKQDDLRKLQTRLERSAKLRAMARSIGVARDTVHRDRLPRRVAQINLAAMEGDINTYLGMFGDPYWVESDESLSFIVHKPGEPPQPATWLSTGQRVVLAMAFWPAVASLFASDLGMLALDEPTANLDEDNRKFLADAVSSLSGKVRGKRQLIMVTHDPNLRTAFDQVIDLGA